MREVEGVEEAMASDSVLAVHHSVLISCGSHDLRHLLCHMSLLSGVIGG